ncbi:MAG: hypothetical protein IH606_22615 [Burkholderiales bacterium]|nr:hypothetical protein [Burkholderiales bacterium]
MVTPNALRLAHNEARALLVRATIAYGKVPGAAKRVADLCLPHFEYEEKNVFPILALLPDLQRGELRREMMAVMPLISDFREKHELANTHHHSILAAVDDLLDDTHSDKSSEFAEFAYNVRVHEKIEDEVIYPAVILIGRYLQERLAN